MKSGDLAGSFPRGLAPALALALTFAYLLGGAGSCAVDAGPELVRVLEIAPREAETGERIALIGDGFPAGKPAQVVFRGTLRRPGERPMKGAEIVARGSA